MFQFFGLKFIPALLVSFALTDFIIGYHSGTHWTWGSVLVIGLMSQYFVKKISYRLFGALTGAFIFSNYQFWRLDDWSVAIIHLMG